MNILSEMLNNAAFSAAFKRDHPQCSECQHVNELIFDGRVYRDVVLKRYCPSCPKFERENDNGNA